MDNARHSYSGYETASTVWADATVGQRRTVVLCGLATFLLLYSLAVYGRLVEGMAAYWWTDVAWTIAALVAGIKCLNTAQRQNQRELRLAWTYFGLAALSWFVGMLIWDYLELIERRLVPYPSLADYLFDAFSVLAIIGAFYFRTQARTKGFTLAQIGNLGIIMCTIIAVLLIVLFEAISASQSSTAYIVFAVNHAVISVAAACFAAFCLGFYSGAIDSRSFALIVLALAVHAVTNTLYAFELFGRTFGAANYLNVAWLVAFALQYWAAFEQDEVERSLVPRQTKSTEPRYRRSIEAVIPGLCLFTIVVVALFYRNEINATLLDMIGLCAALFAGFLVLREWWISRVEAALLEETRCAQYELERRVEERTAQLAEANKELEAFAYSVSHDLRAPLRAINGFSQALHDESGEGLEAHGREYLARIRKASKRMGRLIDDLLELSRMAREPLRKQQVNLSNIARDVVNQLREDDTARDVEVEIDDSLTAYGDPVLLKSVVGNLIDNAWKYTRQTRNARIEFKRATSPHDDRHNAFFVRDNGVGFDMRYAAKLFTPFERLHTTTEFEGTGIGLATVARVIKRHGGRVWVEAAPGEGATFWFEVPAA